MLPAPVAVGGGVALLAWRYVRPAMHGLPSLVLGFGSAYAVYLAISIPFSCSRQERRRIWQASLHAAGLARASAPVN